ncbi:MAG: 2-succinyl-5-enolpyruvyl-6-hydroxy-3-cyclohexene-1-carboxylic-acid synthase [Solirubrobacterales bacterium]
MTQDTYLILRAFVDELVRCGMRAACTAPGSRSTPIVLSLVRDERLRCFSHLDERVAGFFALGLAKASGLPVAVACTSGTAAVELAPAVYEARQARLPLIVLTADRPPELRDVGAGQTVDQLKLYGDAAKWFVEVGTHAATPERLRWVRTLACRAWWTAASGRRGPVHLNFPLREPLVLDEGVTLPHDDSGRAGGRPWVTRPTVERVPSAAVLEALDAELGERRNGVVVAGRDDRHPDLPGAVARFAERTGYPLLADPLSGARRGSAAIAHYDALLRDERFAANHVPDLVLRVGDLPTSKPLRQWLARHPDALQVRLDPEEAWQDPDGVVGTVLAAHPAPTLDALGQGRGALQGVKVGKVPMSFYSGGGVADPAKSPWLRAWREADRAAGEAIASVLGEGLSEPRVAAELGVRLPSTATCFVASSMPVRDVETFWPAREAPPRALGHRGANGIDGTISGALGAAAARGGPVVLLIGDVAFAYDVGALASARRLGLSLTIVLLDNDGGGIFSFLPVAREGDAFVEHVATPHGLDFGRVAELYGCAFERADDPEAFRAALDRGLQSAGVSIVEVSTDRDENVVLHRRVWDAVAQALRPTAEGR